MVAAISLQTALDPVEGYLHWVEIDGMIYILDVLSDAYYALHPDFSESWQRLAGDKSGEYQDAELIEHLVDSGFAIDEHSPDLSSSSLPTAPSANWILKRFPAFVAWRVLRKVAAQLESLPFYQVYTSLKRYPAGNGKPILDIDSATNAFLRAENFFLNRRGLSDCLPRSLALYEFLHVHCGHAVTHHMGVKRYPFAAHAWVTYQQQAIFDKSSQLAEFKTIASFGDD